MRAAPLLLLLAACASRASAPPLAQRPPPAPAAAPVPAAASAAPAPALVPSPPPATPARPVVDRYHGVEVVDPYRWLEDGASPEVKAWTEAQDARTRRFLAALPEREAIGARVKELVAAPVVRWADLEARGGRLFARRRLPGQQQPALVVLPSADRPDAARALVDPGALDPSGGTAIDFYRPSPDGRWVAVSLSRRGTESGDVHFYESDTGREVFEVLPHVNGGTAGGDLAWAADGRTVFYSRYPRAGERPEADLGFFTQVWSHRLGTPVARDRYEVGREFPRTAEIALLAQEGTGRVLATVQEGDSGRFRHWLRERDGRWRRITDYPDLAGAAAFGAGDALYLVSRRDAPHGKLVRLALPAARLDRAVPVIPEDAAAIDWSFEFGPELVVTADRIHVTYQLGGPSELRVFDLSGRRLPGPGGAPNASVAGPTRDGAGGVLFQRTSYVEPPAWWRLERGATEAVRTALRTDHPVDFSDAETRRLWATSRDGTRIPITLVLRRGTPQDGSAPLLATGYGGYGLSQGPAFDPSLRLWLDRGGVYAVVHARGGGEFGEPWHAGGSGAQKQHTFDDFAAALELLASDGWTRPARLAIEGGSNGGILMGAILTQHPELVGAVVSHVGVYDMLRNELTPNGAFNVPEYGTVADPAQFEVLRAYSPYHHVRAGTAYPAVLLLTGANDPRVEPWHSKKLAAALQAATSSARPVLLRVSFEGGHGLSAPLDERVAQGADVFAFLLYELGVTAPHAGAEAAR